MGAVVTKDSTLTCGPAGTTAAPAHGGTIVKSLGAKLTVMNAAVCLALLDGSYVITPLTCKNPTASPGKKCTSVTGAVTGAAKKLTVGGTQVLLDTVDLQGMTDGNPSGKVSATAGQSKLTAS